MCNIAVLSAGVSIPYEKIETCTYNNPHGYGLILRDKKHKKLQVIKECPEEGTDPKKVFDLLEKHKDIDRFLHLRWKTEGPIDIDNTHPFDAYHSDRRQVYFMHNGTLHSYRPRLATTTFEDGVKKEIPGENISDSKKFNDTFLAPFLLRMKGENGLGDIQDEFFKKFLDREWGSNDSKGILICNDLEPLFINFKEWKRLDFGGGEFYSSNNTYWDTLSRGPVFEERRKKKELEEANKQPRFQNGLPNRNITHLADINLKDKMDLKDKLQGLFDNFDIWSDEGIASLELLTEIEVDDLVTKNPTEAAALIVYITSTYTRVYQKYTRLVDYMNKVLPANKRKELENA